MKRCSKCGVEKDLNKFGKLVRSKDGLKSACKICRNVDAKEYHKANKEKVAVTSKVYRDNNKEKEATRHKLYSEANKEKISENGKKHYQANPDKYYANNAKRRAAKLERIVSYANLKAIKDIYSDCVEINLAAKIAGCNEKFVVDHIIPLQGENVSGLHVENNLQIITATENLIKSNKFEQKGENI